MISHSSINSNPAELKFLQDNTKAVSKDESKDESKDVNLSFQEIVTIKGYPLSSYYITTSDGYILKLYRIGGKNGAQHFQDPDPSRKVVLLQHGIADSSDCWFANYELKSLPFILANLGYDVWLGNNRGNKYSRSHLTLNPDKDKSFWDFSFHEMAKFDLKAMLEYIKGTTGRPRITYIGHSQGTAQMFAGLTMELDYFKSTINGFIALGPITNIANSTSTFLSILAKFRLDLLLKAVGFNEVFQNLAVTEKIQNILCKFVTSLCSGLLKLLADVNLEDDDMERLLVFVGHFPSGSSTESFHHFADIIRSKSFVNKETGKPYQLENITGVPISLFVGKNDRLATATDNKVLFEILNKNSVAHFYKEYDNMGHATFFLSKDNSHMDDLLNEIKIYNQ